MGFSDASFNDYTYSMYGNFPSKAIDGSHDTLAMSDYDYVPSNQFKVKVQANTEFDHVLVWVRDSYHHRYDQMIVKIPEEKMDCIAEAEFNTEFVAAAYNANSPLKFICQGTVNNAAEVTIRIENGAGMNGERTAISEIRVGKQASTEGDNCEEEVVTEAPETEAPETEAPETEAPERRLRASSSMPLRTRRLFSR